MAKKGIPAKPPADIVEQPAADVATESSTDTRKIVSREPWWALPPKEGEDEMQCTWGYLIWYSNGDFEFDDSVRPTDDEIRERTSCRA